MEQLSTEAIELLMARARAIEERAALPERAPWMTRHAPALPATPSPPGEMPGMPDLPEQPGPGETAPIAGASHMPMGIERRLVRRAETLWASRRDGRALPPATAAAVLLGPPFAANALLVQSRRLGPPAVQYMGEALRALTTDRPDAGGKSQRNTRGRGARQHQVIARLLRLAVEAIEAGTPLHFDSDDDAGFRGTTNPGILMRAVALPLAAAFGPGIASAVVITSWRTVLSATETAALHKELAAAIDWMHNHSNS